MSRETQNIRRRLRYVERELQAGRVPFVRKYTPGLVDLLHKYGVNLDLYPIPTPSKTPEAKEAQAREKKRLNNKRYYLRGIGHLDKD